MATVIADQESKDVVAPTGQVYRETYEWVLDQATLVPVNVRVVRTPVT